MLERAARAQPGSAAILRTLPVASTRLPAHPASSRAARAFVAGELRGWGLESAVDDATLLVSELVTAAVLHVRTPVDVVVRKVRANVRVEVLEGAKRSNRRLDLDLEASLDRGFSLIEAVACRWGIDQTGDGQMVWFEVAL